MLGFYHPHPRGPATPSAADVAEAAWPDGSYVVAPEAGGRLENAALIGSWRWDREVFERERVEIA